MIYCVWLKIIDLKNKSSFSQVTANSCLDEGYDDYPWPDFFYPGNLPVCSQPVEVTLAAEQVSRLGDIYNIEVGLLIEPPFIFQFTNVCHQFWNCAEVKISNDCDGISPPTSTTTSTIASTTTSTVVSTTSTSVGSTSTSYSTTTTTGATSNPGTCAADTQICGPSQPCSSKNIPWHSALGYN